MKIPRSDTNEVGEYGMTVTSDRATRTAKRTETQKREENHPVGAQTETQNRIKVLQHGGAPLVAESGVG